MHHNASRPGSGRAAWGAYKLTELLADTDWKRRMKRDKEGTKGREKDASQLLA